MRGRAFSGLPFEEPGDRFASAINFPLPNAAERHTVSLGTDFLRAFRNRAYILEIENSRRK